MKILKLLSVSLLVSVICSCGGDKAGPLAELADIYFEMYENVLEVKGTAIKLNRKSSAERLAGAEQLQKLQVECEKNNAKLAEKAISVAEGMKGQSFPAEASQATGVNITECKIQKIEANRNMANIWVECRIEGTFNGKPYFALVEADDFISMRNAATPQGETIVCNFRITLRNAAEYGEVAKLVLLTQYEYSANKAHSKLLLGEESDTMEAASYAQPDGDEEAMEPEPAYEGIGEGVESVGDIKKGMPLAETIRRAGSNVTWDYNADSGVWCHLSGVAIVISEDDLTAKGLEIINAIPSDMADNITLSVDYIKAEAKINHIEKE